MESQRVDVRWGDLLALEASARERLRPEVYDYFAGGADAESTVADNRSAWSEIRRGNGRRPGEPGDG